MRLKKRYLLAKIGPVAGAAKFDEKAVSSELLQLFGELHFGLLYLKVVTRDSGQVLFRCERSQAQRLAGALPLLKSARLVPVRISGSVKGALGKNKGKKKENK